MKKVIFVDIDGTLRNEKRELTKETIKEVKRAQKNGYEIILCSGRSREYCANVSRQCGASKYVINSNGAEGYNYLENKVIFQDNFSEEDKKILWDFGKENNLGMAFNCENERLVTDDYSYYNSADIKLNSLDDVINKNVVQIVLSGNGFDYMLNMKTKIEKLETVQIGNYSKSLILKKEVTGESYIYDMVKKGVNKGNGIEKFCNELGIDLSECIAIGDNENDLSMFKKVGISVAMGNATDRIKSKANYIAKRNDENGVAEFLKMLLEDE